jgi:hypothetical protein
MDHAPHFGSIVIDRNTAPGAITAELIANVPTPIVTWGVNGLGRGRVEPQFDRGRIVVREAGDYRIDLNMSLESDDGNSKIFASILRSGVATHIGAESDVENAASQRQLNCADHLTLDADDYISLSLETTVGARLTMSEATLIVTRM